ncbi:hypothetical protein [Candidatus Cyanaurora vandensis]|uniref:hypothetical protein n=1 Tax=Candidatus Cyanaurora vandensis TaxID=2714958 RepID=UPI00257D448F|nr:hypothetical protein [Candidatus Cyanaurora vandensis]
MAITSTWLKVFGSGNVYLMDGGTPGGLTAIQKFETGHETQALEVALAQVRLSGFPVPGTFKSATDVGQDTALPVVSMELAEVTSTWLRLCANGDVYLMCDNTALQKFITDNEAAKLRAVLDDITDGDFPFPGTFQLASADTSSEANIMLVVSSPAIQVTVRSSGSSFFAQVNGSTQFFVGKRVSFRPRPGVTLFGLRNIESSGAVRYQPEDWVEKFGFWAFFILPITKVESAGGLFHCLNTYDRARFTIGFLQYAAHVANGDFVKFFRKVLSTPLGQSYFPDLTLVGGIIHQIVNGNTVSLEVPNSKGELGQLMAYLNPSLDRVDDVEVVQAAKFVHLIDQHKAIQELQVSCGVDHIKTALKLYDSKLALDGVSDRVCLVIVDIFHQGRSKFATVREILNDFVGDKDGAYDRLIRIGAANFSERVNGLDGAIKSLVAQGKLGGKTYSKSQGEFV